MILHIEINLKSFKLVGKIDFTLYLLIDSRFNLFNQIQWSVGDDYLVGSCSDVAMSGN